MPSTPAATRPAPRARAARRGAASWVRVALSEPEAQAPATVKAPNAQAGAVQAPPATAPAAAGQAPTEASLGVPFFPSMQFLASYDAGDGQRYYLFGTNASFQEVVTFYKAELRQRGDLVFDAPATQMFDLGRYREETMAFPPSLTVKDYTWNGMTGYPNPSPNGEPARFKTVVQIVPPPAAVPPAKR